jgi:hypothetical protein
MVRWTGLGGPWELQPLPGPSGPRLSLQRFKSEDAPKIHMSLSGSLFFLNLLFLINVGSGSKGPTASCWTRATAFHYFLLCTFTWMGLEAFHLYLLTIRVFNTYFRHYFLKLSLLGWGGCCWGGWRRGWRGQGGQRLGDGGGHNALDKFRAWGWAAGRGQRSLCQGTPGNATCPSLMPRPACPHGHWHWECQQLWPLHHP